MQCPKMESPSFGGEGGSSPKGWRLHFWALGRAEASPVATQFIAPGLQTNKTGAMNCVATGCAGTQRNELRGYECFDSTWSN